MLTQAIDLLLEGFETAFFPCSLVLLIPGLATAITARQESSAALTGYGAAVLVVGWLRFSARIDDTPTVIVAMAFAAAALLLIVPLIRRLNIVSATGGAIAGLAAASLWEPCVGAAFGSLLVDLPGGGPGSFVMMSLYLAGIVAPLAVLGAVLHVIPNPTLLPIRPVMMFAGGAVFFIMAIATATGFVDSVIGQLVQWSI